MGQLPSHASVPSMTPLPHTAAHSLSLLALHAGWPAAGMPQQPSLLLHAATGPASTQRASHVDVAPASVRTRHDATGQLVGQLPSHSSVPSTTPLPHMTPHSASLLALQRGCPAGGMPQQPSPDVHTATMDAFSQRASHVVAAPTSRRSWQPIAGHVVGQSPSHSSLPSRTPLPHWAAQSLSLVALHAGRGQQRSLFTHAVCCPETTHWAVHVPGFCSVRRSQAFCGHDDGHCDAGSHSSPVSCRPLPQNAGQSTSTVAAVMLHPGGQQPSLVVPEHPFATVLQRALQRDALPVYVRVSQHTADTHCSAVEHVPGGSHVSPSSGSTTPSPQPAQSLSVAALHPAGQQRSRPAVEHVFGVWVHTTLHVAADPVLVSVVQSSWSSHTGHDPGGSQVSPASRTPLPQAGALPPAPAAPALPPIPTPAGATVRARAAARAGATVRARAPA